MKQNLTYNDFTIEQKVPLKCACSKSMRDLHTPCPIGGIFRGEPCRIIQTRIVHAKHDMEPTQQSFYITLPGPRKLDHINVVNKYFADLSHVIQACPFNKIANVRS